MNLASVIFLFLIVFAIFAYVFYKDSKKKGKENIKLRTENWELKNKLEKLSDRGEQEGR